MPFELAIEPEPENSVVKSFRIRPSDWAEVERVAKLYNLEPTRFVRKILLMGLEEAKSRASARQP